MGDFRKLLVWQKAHGVTLAAYRATSAFPDSERFGLAGQIRRAAVSVPANIAEGIGRNADPQAVQFLRIALGSASELSYLLLLAEELGMLSGAGATEQQRDVAECRRMLAGLITRLQRSPRHRPVAS